MKKSLSILLLIYLNLICVLFADVKFSFIGKITADNVNIMSGYNINFEIVHKTKHGDKMVVLDKKFNWYKVALPLEANSFISKQYVVKKSSLEGEVNTERVNVRARPSLKSSILCQVTKGDSVTIVKKFDDDWYQIQPPENCYGWVYDKYLRYYSTIEEYEKEKNKIVTSNAESAESSIVDVADLEYKTAARQLESEKKFDFEQIGTIKRYTFFTHPGSYKLTRDGKTICYLKGEKAKLNSFVNLEVKVLGRVQDRLSYKYPVVIVEKILINE